MRFGIKLQLRVGVLFTVCGDAVTVQSGLTQHPINVTDARFLFYSKLPYVALRCSAVIILLRYKVSGELSISSCKSVYN